MTKLDIQYTYYSRVHMKNKCLLKEIEIIIRFSLEEFNHLQIYRYKPKVVGLISIVCSAWIAALQHKQKYSGINPTKLRQNLV